MVGPYLLATELQAFAQSLLGWAPRCEGEQLGAPPRTKDQQCREAPSTPDDAKGGFIARTLLDEQGHPFLGWVYEGWLLSDAADTSSRKRRVDPSASLKDQLGPRCVRVTRTADIPPWIRVTAEFRGERESRALGPYRDARLPLVTDDHDAPWRPARIVSSEEDLLPRTYLMVIQTKDPVLLGKRFLLDQSPMVIGRSKGAVISFEGDTTVSRRHAQVEKREQGLFLVDLGSTGGTFCNGTRLAPEVALNHGDRVAIGRTIVKVLRGTQADYHEEVYQMTIKDNLTQIFNRRYFHEALDREIVRSRRRSGDLAVLLFDLQDFHGLLSAHTPLAGDHALKEICPIVQARIGPDDVFARYSDHEFAILLPGRSLTDAVALAETLRDAVRTHPFNFGNQSLTMTIATNVAVLEESDRGGTDLLARATG